LDKLLSGWLSQADADYAPGMGVGQVENGWKLAISIKE
jgi:hypothetical protein